MANSDRVLITGGAGFVGSHLADALARSGHEVTLFDALEPQVHGGEAGVRPDYLDPAHRLVPGDIRNPDALAPLLREADVVVHLAAMVGVGQSMYQVRRYCDVNVMGTANLLQLLVEDRARVRKLVIASSMSVYGEGAYECPKCGPVAPRLRGAEQLAAHDWEPRCPRCGESVAPLPTSEEKPLAPASIYAINKRDQEEMFLAFGSAYQIPVVALRFFNIYGSRQALSNPYTGVAAIFCARLLADKPPLLYEDGHQMRDLVHVSDVVQALRLAIDDRSDDQEVFNVGSGSPLSVRQLAAMLSTALGRQIEPEATDRHRAGDIRHCFADIARIRSRLGYEPKVTFDRGVAELIEWVFSQTVPGDSGVDVNQHLLAHGLAR